MEVQAIVSAECVDQLVQRYCENHHKRISDFEISNYRVQTLSDSPQGFLGQHYFLQILIRPKYESKDNEIQLKFFVKKAPASIESFITYVDDLQVFSKECRLLKELIPRLQSIHSKFGRFAPECYYGEEKLLILEDLSDQEFRMKSSGDQLLDYSHLLCAVKTLAKFHSASVILEKKKLHRHLDEIYSGIFTENAFPARGQNPVRSAAIENGAVAVCALIEMIPKYRNSTKLSWIVDKYREKFHKMPEYCRSSKRFRNVFLHGDLWSNNIMFRYDDLNNPIDCKIMDFQLSRYAPPVLDLVTLLSATTTSDFRNKTVDALFENYYHFFDEFLAVHDEKIDDFISKIEFKECIGYYREFGMLMSCHITHETLIPSFLVNELYADSDLFTDFMLKDRAKFCRRAFQEDAMYRERMTDMITDFVDNFILKDYCEHIF